MPPQRTKGSCPLMICLNWGYFSIQASRVNITPAVAACHRLICKLVLNILFLDLKIALHLRGLVPAIETSHAGVFEGTGSIAFILRTAR